MMADFKPLPPLSLTTMRQYLEEIETRTPRLLPNEPSRLYKPETFEETKRYPMVVPNIAFVAGFEASYQCYVQNELEVRNRELSGLSSWCARDFHWHCYRVVENGAEYPLRCECECHEKDHR